MEKYSYFIMISPEKKKEILDLKKQGYTNTKIKEKTGISLPTIRKILKQSTQNKKIPEIKVDSDTITGSVIGDEIFIINLTRNWPSRGYTFFQRLRNGVPSWRLSVILRERYPEYIVSDIVEQINQKGGAWVIYQVNISKNNAQEVTVSPLTLKTMKSNQIAE